VVTAGATVQRHAARCRPITSKKGAKRKVSRLVSVFFFFFLAGIIRFQIFHQKPAENAQMSGKERYHQKLPHY
jgi:hypothetical protein